MPDDKKTAGSIADTGTITNPGTLDTGGGTVMEVDPVLRQSDAVTIVESAHAAAKDAAKGAAETAMSDMKEEVIKMARDAARAAVEAAMADMSSPAGLPEILDGPWNALKSWVRKEADLALAGHSIATREQLNP